MYNTINDCYTFDGARKNEHLLFFVSAQIDSADIVQFETIFAPL